jgi:signal peptidase II
MREPIPVHRYLLFWSIALGGAALDLTTKALIFDWIGPPGAPPRRIVANILELRTSFNKGALWGFAASVRHSSLIFAGLSVVAAFAICYWLFARGGAADKRLTAALGLIMAGALGNCYDRLALGQVRDFIHFHVDSIGFDFPIFNAADSMLVIGATALMLLALLPETPAQPDEPLHTEAAEAVGQTH